MPDTTNPSEPDNPAPAARPKRKRPPVMPIQRLTPRGAAEDAAAPAAANPQVAVAVSEKRPAPSATSHDTEVPAASGNGNVSQDLFGPAPYPRAPLPPRVPPRSTRVPMPRGALLATVFTGTAAAVFIPLDRPGIGWVLAGLATVGAIYTVDRIARRAARPAAEADDVISAEAVGGAAAPPVSESGVEPVSRASATGVGVTGAGGDSTFSVRRWAPVWWTVIAVGLLAVGAFRAEEWLVASCLVGAAVAGSLAVVRRSVYGVVFDMVAVPVSAVLAVLAVPWVYRGMQRVRGWRVSSTQRVGWSVLATVIVLAVFVPLLAGADAVFARLVESVIPEFDADSVVRWGFVFTVAGLGAAGALYLLAGPPPVAGETESVAGRLVRKRWSRLEWGLPLGVLTVVFAVFVATQLAVLFGGNGYVQRTAELTYAEYARSGFWQLSIVSMLTLGVIAVVQAWAAQESAGDRRWLRIVVAAVSVLTLVIVASALHRMWTYQQAYGFTVLRLLVEVFEVWIGLVYLLVLASLVRLRRDWVPRAAVGEGAATLLGLALVNPEGLIADRNIDRWLSGTTVEVGTGSGSREITQDLDIDYLGELSADALPAVDRLPEPQRGLIAAAIRDGMFDSDTWQGWNWSRTAAR
ncbi:DUF4153 domain-containing protein [Nocardia crassostreae]|uniref:DUF4153 domain-containing protein n=1 Tax=Nocardia crassostreae TaxID=53428 RepID=UPI000AB58484|nr:DUF4153 domain-containing protein [Nocardia crassostreae]